jgi:hypothetical protein
MCGTAAEYEIEFICCNLFHVVFGVQFFVLLLVVF